MCCICEAGVHLSAHTSSMCLCVFVYVVCVKVHYLAQIYDQREKADGQKEEEELRSVGV